MGSCHRAVNVAASLLPNGHVTISVTEQWSAPPCVSNVWITHLDPTEIVSAIDRREGRQCVANFEYPLSRAGYAYRIGDPSSALKPGRYAISAEGAGFTSAKIIVAPAL